jgi:anti-anti-sigma factor
LGWSNNVHHVFAGDHVAQLHIDTSRSSPATVRIAAVGEIDLATAPILHDGLLTVLHEQTPAVLHVDLAGVTFLDCTGIGVLVAVRHAAVHTGRQLRITHPQPIVRRILDLTGLLGVLTAPIEQPQPCQRSLPTRSEYRSGTGAAHATVTRAARRDGCRLTPKVSP